MSNDVNTSGVNDSCFVDAVYSTATFECKYTQLIPNSLDN